MYLHYYQLKEFEDTNGVISIRISEKNRTTQWSKEKVLKNKQGSTKDTHKTKDRVPRPPLTTKEPTTIYKTINRKQRSSHTNLIKNRG